MKSKKRSFLFNNEKLNYYSSYISIGIFFNNDIIKLNNGYFILTEKSTIYNTGFGKITDILFER